MASEMSQDAMDIVNKLDFKTKQIDCAKLRRLLELLHNAPPNLRFGPTDYLGSFLDPMGDRSGKMTNKEYKWYDETEYRNDLEPTSFTVTNIAGHKKTAKFLGSSTGTNMKDKWIYTHTKMPYWFGRQYGDGILSSGTTLATPKYKEDIYYWIECLYQNNPDCMKP